MLSVRPVPRRTSVRFPLSVLQQTLDSAAVRFVDSRTDALDDAKETVSDHKTLQHFTVSVTGYVDSSTESTE